MTVCCSKIDGLRGDKKWRTTGHMLADLSRRYSDRLAIVDVNRSLTYSELHAETRRFAQTLLANGVARGERVAIWAPNSWKWVIAALGAHSVGAAIVPVNTRYKGREAAYILERSNPAVLVMVSEFLGHDYPEMLRSAAYRPRRTPLTISIEAEDDASWQPLHADGAVDDGQLDERLDEIDGDVVSDVLFTSGTTGYPKGVITTHAQNLRAYYDWSTLAGIQAGDRCAIVNPFFHAFGYKAGWLSCFMHGATIYPHAILDVPRLANQVAAERITVLPGPPALYHSLLAQRHSAQDLSSLRLAITGAASIPTALVRRIKETLGFERVTTCYGMTEGSGVATITRADNDLETVARTSGSPLPGIELRLLGDDGDTVATGELGEVLLRGYNVMQGYLGDPEGSRASVDADGWLHTGDIGLLDDAGRLRVTDRKGDMFVVGGFNVYPAEIENVLSEHPDIAQVAVIGIPDERMGEVGCAFVVPVPGTAPDADSITAWVRPRLANFKVPRRVVFIDQLPQNATGKVLKQDLRIPSTDEVNNVP